MKIIPLLLLMCTPFAVSQQAPAGAPPVPPAVPVVRSGDLAPLTEGEVQAAITRGSNDKRPIGVHVQSVDAGDFAGTGCRHCGETTFNVTVYSTQQWIEAQAFAAKQAKKPFTADNVPESMRRPVVYVIAQEVRNDLDLTASATDIGFRAIQLAGDEKATKVEPLLHKFTQQTGAPGSGLTGYITTATATAVFSVDSVKGVLAKNNAEFDVVLTLPTRQKVLKVKASGLNLPL